MLVKFFCGEILVSVYPLSFMSKSFPFERLEAKEMKSRGKKKYLQLILVSDKVRGRTLGKRKEKILEKIA